MTRRTQLQEIVDISAVFARDVVELSVPDLAASLTSPGLRLTISDPMMKTSVANFVAFPARMISSSHLGVAFLTMFPTSPLMAMYETDRLALDPAELRVSPRSEAGALTAPALT
jgi:hypothetical protein